MRKNIHHATGPNVFVLSASGLTQREEEERGGKKASMVRIQNFCLEKREETLDSRGQDGEFNLCSGSNCPTELGNTHCTNNGASKSINPSSSRANFHKRASHNCSGRKRVNMLPWRGAN